jgi:hypothetical protein
LSKERDDPESIVDEGIARVIQEITEDNPTYGYRRVWAVIRFD